MGFSWEKLGSSINSSQKTFQPGVRATQQAPQGETIILDGRGESPSWETVVTGELNLKTVQGKKTA